MQVQVQQAQPLVSSLWLLAWLSDSLLPVVVIWPLFWPLALLLLLLLLSLLELWEALWMKTKNCWSCWSCLLSFFCRHALARALPAAWSSFSWLLAWLGTKSTASSSTVSKQVFKVEVSTDLRASSICFDVGLFDTSLAAKPIEHLRPRPSLILANELTNEMGTCFLEARHNKLQAPVAKFKR